MLLSKNRNRFRAFGKYVAVAAVSATLLTGLAGCGGADDPGRESTSYEDTGAASSSGGEEGRTSAEGDSAPAGAEGGKDSEGQEKTSAADETKESGTGGSEDTFVADRSAVFELLSKMNVGWNLGNTFDSRGAGNSLRAETYWGNPETSREMIDAVAAQGFNTIRIPVTWAEHLGPAPDYKIDGAWLDRVQEVVDYCVGNDMYIVLDTHHEPDYWMTPEPAKKDAVKKELMALWTQIAERFKDYDNKLLFEGMNENRIKGSEAEWSGGTAEERVVINELNQAFIDAVRAVGGNNAERCLIISTYGNSASYNAVKDLEIPQDNNIAVAVHMYTPYVFTYEADYGNTSTWDGSLKKDITATLKQLDKYFLKDGLPVIVTEFGAVNKGNEQEIIKWIQDYLGQMNKYGIKCIWWDNGNYKGAGERFAIFNRRNCTWYYPDVADALTEFAAQE